MGGGVKKVSQREGTLNGGGRRDNEECRRGFQKLGIGKKGKFWEPREEYKNLQVGEYNGSVLTGMKGREYRSLGVHVKCQGANSKSTRSGYAETSPGIN